MFRLPGVCLPAPASHFATNTSKMKYSCIKFFIILKQLYQVVLKKVASFVTLSSV
jgi:hypothetical protein